jgi:hypothetical protein
LTGEKQKVKKNLRFAPDVVDPCTDKKEYLNKHLEAIAARYNLVEEEISSSDIAPSVPPLEFVENSSVRAVESKKKEDTNALRSCIARPTGICNFILS